MQWLGFGVTTLGVVEQRQVVQAGGRIGVVRAQRLLTDRQRPAIQRLGLGIPGTTAKELFQKSLSSTLQQIWARRR